MNGARMLLLLLIPLTTSKSYAQETIEETTTLEANNVSGPISPSSDSQVQLDSTLRNALLKALSELESDKNNEEAQELENEEKPVERAQATAVTYLADEDTPHQQELFQNQQDQTKTFGNQNIATINETTENSVENLDRTQKASEVTIQKSNSIQSGPITAIEREPADFFKDAEQIITSASNSFITQNGDESVSSHTPRSVENIGESNVKIASSSNLNTIVDLESKSKPLAESPFVKTYVRPLGNVVSDDVAYVKPTETYVKLTNVGVSSKSSVTSEVKSIESGDFLSRPDATTAEPVVVSTEESEAKVEQVQFFSAPLVAAFTVHQDEKGQPKKVESIFKNEINTKKLQNSVQPNFPQDNANFQSSTFNSLDLQKKQQILEQELEKLRNQQFLQQQSLISRNNFQNNQGFNIQGSSNLGLSQSSFSQAVKQNFNQYDPMFTEPDRSVVTKLATIDPTTLLSQSAGLVLNRFTPNDAILPLSNPVKPSFINKIVPDSKSSLKNPNKGDVSIIPSITFDPLIEAGKLPLNAQILPNKEPTGFLNFLPKTQNLAVGSQIQHSASAANTHLGQQVSSSLEQPTSNFAQANLNKFSNNNLASTQRNLPNNPISNLIQPNSNVLRPNSNFAQTNFNTFNSISPVQQQQNLLKPNQNLAQPNQNFLQPSSNFIQPSISQFANPTNQNKGQVLQNVNFLGNQNSQVGLNSAQSQSNNFVGQGLGSSNLFGFNKERGQSVNQNRILRQEQGIVNPGFNQNSFSIIPSQQPFDPKHEVSYFLDNNRFLSQNQGNSLGQQSNFVGKNTPNSNVGFQGTQNNFRNGNNLNQNRLFRSNLEGTAANPNFKIQQNVQPFGHQGFTNNIQNNRFLKSNPESSRTSPQNFDNNQNLNQNLGFTQSQIGQNNRFLRSNLESSLLSNQNRYLAQPTIQNYRYSNSFGFPNIPLNKK